MRRLRPPESGAISAAERSQQCYGLSVDVAPNPPLLESLDALVRAQPGPTGLKGSVCFGVRGAHSTRWWRADFGSGGAVTDFLDYLPAHVDVAVGLDPDEAAALLADDDAEPRPEGLRLIAGDAELLSRFISRYVARQSMLGLRASKGADRK